MKLKYKRLGNYIHSCDEINSGMQVKQLLGINNEKFFVKAKTNTNGVNLEKYRIVRRRQFGFNRATTRNGDKISIALREGDDCIVSPSYRIFEVNNTNELLPEYLMMWFRRPEFDRYARFKSHGSAHEFFSYEDMCEVELPVPHIEKQREIVKEYNTIVNRIKVNDEHNARLEETAQAIYNHWFINFEFPISKDYAEEIGKPELEGKPYKSSGCKFNFNSKLNTNIPVVWGADAFTSLIELKGGGTPSTDETSYWNGSIPFFTPKDVGISSYSTKTEKHITSLGLNESSTKLYTKDTVFITARGTVGAVSLASCDMAMNQSCYAAIGKEYNQFFVHQHVVQILKYLKNVANGGVFGALVTKDFSDTYIIKPDLETTELFKTKVKPCYDMIFIKQVENDKLLELKNLILSKMAK